MWVTEEQIERAKQTDLLSYLQRHEPDNLQRLGSSTYCTKEHDSLKISNGLWHWFSRNIGGKDALDYLIKVKGFSFPDAVAALTEDSVPMNTGQGVRFQPVKKEFELPPLNPDIAQVKRYLMRRGIDGRLIDYCHRYGMLYEDAQYHNCIFIGRDEAGAPKYGAVRSTVSNFKRELDGSDKRYSFRITPAKEASAVNLFESAIDLLSYITLELMNHRDWTKEDYLSLGGVYANRENRPNVPVALQAYLDRNPNTERVCLHLDNDEIGRRASTQIMWGLHDKYDLFDIPPTRGKDINDELRIKNERSSFFCQNGSRKSTARLSRSSSTRNGRRSDEKIQNPGA